ncbi:MAG: extracellular solute-binding protein [Chloroflexi bacterium]|nr:extracellular solute-binding protein [Chloroflexota bacterium]
MASTRRAAIAQTILPGAAVAAACGPLGRGAPATGGQTAAPAKIMLGHRSRPEYDPLVQEALPLFRQRQPKIDVEYQPVTGTWNEKFTATWAAGVGPDVFEAWDQWFWQFGAKGILVNMNDHVRDLKKSDVDDFARWQWDGFQIPNTTFRYGMPKYINMGVVYYNKAMFERAGQRVPAATWNHDDYAALLKRLTRTGDQPVFGGRIPYASFTRYQPHLLAYGGSMVDPKDSTKAALHLPPAMQAWQWIWDRMFQDNTLIQRRQEQEQGWSSFRDGLAQGRIATAEDGMHALIDVAAKMSAEWDILAMPRGLARRASWGTTDGWGMWRGSQSRAAAWELVKFLSGPEYIRMQSRITLYLPPRQSALDEWVKLVRGRYPVLERVNLKVVQEALAGTEPYVTVNQQFLCYQEMIAVFQPILNDIFRDGKQQPAYLRDVRGQIEQAAASCGATFR